MPTQAPPGRIRILASYPELVPSANPFLPLLESSTAYEVDWIPFGFRTALTGRYDIFHVHWPETMIRRTTRVKTVICQLLFGLLLIRLRVRRTPIIRTLHNSDPHEGVGWLAKRLLRALDRETDTFILLSSAQTAPVGSRHLVIPHGHYRSWYVRSGRSAEPGRVLYFGLIRPYKAVPDLISSFANARLPERLDVMGNPSGDEDRRAVQDAQTTVGDPRVHLTLGHIDDDQLVQAIEQAELIVLPYQRLENSGALLLALSLDRPVLVPATATTEALVAEVGAAWVLPYDPSSGGPSIDAALDTVRTDPRPSQPDLSSRDWSLIGRQYVLAYREALARR